MNKDDYSKAGLQRLFQKGADNFLLLHKNGKAVAFNQIRMEMLISLIVKLMLISDRQVSHYLMMVGNVLGQDWNTAACLNDTIDWYKRDVSQSLTTMRVSTL